VTGGFSFDMDRLSNSVCPGVSVREKGTAVPRVSSVIADRDNRGRDALGPSDD
jgi:arginase family enzyme